jgi:hypothetical protein
VSRKRKLSETTPVAMQRTITEIHQATEMGMRVEITADDQRILNAMLKRSDLHTKVPSPYTLEGLATVRELQAVINQKHQSTITDNVVNGFIAHCNHQSNDWHCYNVEYLNHLCYQETFYLRTMMNERVNPFRYKEVVIPSLGRARIWNIVVVHMDKRHVTCLTAGKERDEHLLSIIKSWIRYQLEKRRQRGSVDHWTYEYREVGTHGMEDRLEFCLALNSILAKGIGSMTDQGLIRKQLIKVIIMKTQRMEMHMNVKPEVVTERMASIPDLLVQEYLLPAQSETQQHDLSPISISHTHTAYDTDITQPSQCILTPSEESIEDNTQRSSTLAKNDERPP